MIIKQRLIKTHVLPVPLSPLPFWELIIDNINWLKHSMDYLQLR